MYKIILTGPESTGKSTLAKRLSEYYNTVYVPEYARLYLEKLEQAYQEDDLVKIARGQIMSEKDAILHARRFLFCDTSMLVLKVWSEYKYGVCHPYILQQLYMGEFSMFFLCGIDIPWQYDELRENPSEREELYGIYKRELERMNFPWVELSGDLDTRMEKAIKVLQEFFVYLNLT